MKRSATIKRNLHQMQDQNDNEHEHVSKKVKFCKIANCIGNCNVYKEHIQSRKRKLSIDFAQPREKKKCIYNNYLYYSTLIWGNFLNCLLCHAETKHIDLIDLYKLRLVNKEAKKRIDG